MLSWIMFFWIFRFFCIEYGVTNSFFFHILVNVTGVDYNDDDVFFCLAIIYIISKAKTLVAI